VEVPEPPRSESQRLATLRALEILDSEPEAAFDRITSLAATLFRVPTVLISLIDAHRQWFKSSHGLDAKETARDISFCGHAILQAEPMVVPDARSDKRFSDNPLVLDDPKIRFYAGAPLTTPNGHTIGTLCLIDQEPRDLTALERQVLSDLAALVVSEIELRAARRQKARESAELQALLRDFPTAVIVADDDNTVQFVNTEAERLLGYDASELLGQLYTRFVHPEERDASTHVANAARLPSSRPRAVTRTLVRKTGEVLTVQGTAGRLTWAGRPAIAVAMRDVTNELREEEQRARENRRVVSEMKLLLAAFDVLPDGVVLFDQDFRCSYANRAVGEMLGVDPATLIGRTPEDAARHVSKLVARGAKESAPTKGWRDATDDKFEPKVFSLVRPSPRVIRRTLHKLDSSTHPYLSLWSDITHEAVALARSQEEASTDALTGLANRRAAAARLSQALSHGGVVAVVLFDIDHFKRINDTLGHAVGDQVIQRVGQTLQSCARDGDLIARWGGEEFIGVLCGNAEGARKFAERARLSVAALKTEAGPITISGGVAEGVAGTDPVKLADEKLYEAKRSGRNRVCG
jgi:diguanylate cyclase (GGDEF)-like protein/PAS domain S-box-containing protein